MDIEWSKQYLTTRYDWVIDESTFQVLDEERGLWIASVTTTHNSARGKPEHSFYVLVCYSEHFVIQDHQMLALKDWCLKQVKG